MSPKNPTKQVTLEQLTKEAASAKIPDKNWDAMEASLFDRIDSAETAKAEQPALAEVVAFPHPFPPGFARGAAGKSEWQLPRWRSPRVSLSSR